MENIHCQLQTKMQTVYEFRVVEEFAPKLFANNEGKRLGDTVRKIELAADDPRFDRIGQLQKQMRATTDRSFFYGWNIRHVYSKAELAAANCFRLIVTPTFEPAGQECGTKYDEAKACPKCGAGAKQVSDLFLDWSRVPKGKDFSRTIAGEVVASRGLADLFRKHVITGVEFLPVRRNPASSAVSSEWTQMVVQSAGAETVSPTLAGIDPFDTDTKGECRCPTGDLIGLGLLSEVSIKSATRGTQDVVCTRQFVGTRRGLLRPERIILVSQKVRQVIESEKLKGFKLEIAHLV
jgi:hypothetical protein